MDKCKYCGSTNLFTEMKGTNLGLYCADCADVGEKGKWQQWLKQDRPATTGEIASDAQQKYARYLLNKWRESKQPMLSSEAGAIIGAFKERWG